VFLRQTSNDAALTNLPLMCAVFIKIRLAAVGKKINFYVYIMYSSSFPVRENFRRKPAQEEEDLRHKAAVSLGCWGCAISFHNAERDCM
jgi:hypothetical protein